jgi:hypothetical protein
MIVDTTIVEVLPALQRTISTLHDRECMSLGIPTADVSCIVDITIASGLRVDAGEVPLIRISPAWVFDCVINERTEIVVKALRRAIMLAYSKLRWTLGKRKTRNAAEYIEKARGFRLAAGDTFSLPLRSFRVRYSVDMYDPMTGESESRSGVRSDELEYVERELATLLTAKVYSHEQAAKLLDLLHAHKMAMQEPAAVVAVDIKQLTTEHVVETVEYEDFNASVDSNE